MSRTTSPTPTPLPRRGLAVVVALALFGATCGGPSTDPGVVEDFPNEPITLTIWRPADEGQYFEKFYRGYQREHKNVSFEYRFIKPENYETEVLNALATGNGPDIISLQNDRIPKFAGTLVPMPDRFFGSTAPITGLTSKFAPAVATDAVYEGEVYGVPFYTDTLMLYVNSQLMNDIFTEHLNARKEFNRDLLTKPPADWSAVVDTVKLVTKRKGNTIERPGIALGMSKNVPHMDDITAAIMLEQDLEMVTPDHKGAAFHLADPDKPNSYPGEAVLNFLKGFVDPGSDYYTWNADQPDAVQLFIDGKLPMMINYRSVNAYIQQRNPSLQVAHAPFPQVANAERIVDFASYHLEVVTNNSKNPQVAWDFLRNTIEYELVDYLFKTEKTSPFKDVKATTTVAQRRNKTPYEFQVPTAQSWYKGKNAVGADSVIRQMVDQVTVDRKPARESLFEAGSAMTRSLSGP